MKTKYLPPQHTKSWRPCFILLLLILGMAGCGARSADPPAEAAVDLTSRPESVQGVQPSQPVLTAPIVQPPAVAIDAMQSETNSFSPSPTAEVPSVQAETLPAGSPQAATLRATLEHEIEAAAVLEKQLAEFVIPPVWLASVDSTWDRAKPWKEARLEIRRLLGIGDQKSRQEALRLMWDYRQKNDFGDGHEYGMYTFLGKEPVWAIRACRDWLAREDHKYPPDFCIKSLASLYRDRGMFSEAENVLRQGLDWPPADVTWRQAEYLDSLGDLYVAWGRVEEARKSYQDSVRLYPQTNPPYGKHLIPRRVKTVQSKLDILSLNSFEGIVLRDGTWNATAAGYSGDIQVTAQVRQGRLVVIRIRHEEKIDQGATVEIPRRIVDQQRLDVDGISGATITKDAIVAGTLGALRQAGLQ